MNIEALRDELDSYLNSTSNENLIAEMISCGFEFEDPWLSEEELDLTGETFGSPRAADSNQLALAA
jgi:hypothetical protein